MRSEEKTIKCNLSLIELSTRIQSSGMLDGKKIVLPSFTKPYSEEPTNEKLQVVLNHVAHDGKDCDQKPNDWVRSTYISPPLSQWMISDK